MLLPAVTVPKLFARIRHCTFLEVVVLKGKELFPAATFVLKNVGVWASALLIKKQTNKNKEIFFMFFFSFGPTLLAIFGFSHING